MEIFQHPHVPVEPPFTLAETLILHSWDVVNRIHVHRVVRKQTWLQVIWRDRLSSPRIVRRVRQRPR